MKKSSAKNHTKINDKKPQRPYMNGWVVENKKLVKEFSFHDFKDALDFANKVGQIAEKENHHPDINIHNWNKVLISLATHETDNITQKDYEVASKINDEISKSG